MKCPKCHYLSFEPEPRCKNCGFTLTLDESDFEFTPDGADAPLLDLDLRTAPPEPAVAPLSATPIRTSPTPPARVAVPPLSGPPLFAPAQPPAPSSARPGPFDAIVEHDAIPDLPASTSAFVTDARPLAFDAVPSVSMKTDALARSAAAEPIATPRAAAPATSEMPLFVKDLQSAPATQPDLIDDEPLVQAPAEPRPPLAVRRPAQEPTIKSRTATSGSRKIGPLDRDLLDDLQRIEQVEERDRAAETRAAARLALPEDRPGAASRLGAAVTDSLLMTGLAAALLSITLRWCGLSWDQIGMLPVLPTAAFLLVVGVGYLLMFTAAGGQTLGKMLFGLRVVDAGEPGNGRDPISMKQAIYREIVSVPSVMALGAGFIPALMSDERALHDRLAGTRVVRA